MITKQVKNIALWWHTIKFLRWKQIAYRIYYKLFRLESRKLLAQTYKLRKWNGPWSSPYLFERSMFENQEVIIFRKKRTIKFKNDWNHPSFEKLWLYHLHYLNDLNAQNACDLIIFHYQLINEWIRNNPPAKGIGWEPYPLSLRIVNLIKWFSRNSEFVNELWLNNLGLQIQALCFQIEYHILANHLFVNGKALIFAGIYFDGSIAASWLKKGLKIIDEEVKEQFLIDGGHYELSPMYHANLLWDMCDLVYLSQINSINELKLREKKWIEIINKGMAWLAHMSHPDGEISYFNDASQKMAPTLKELLAYAKQLGIHDNIPIIGDSLILYSLPQSGYDIITFDNRTKLILDVGRIGVDYQPGHAHADTLSFELSLFKQRFIVNTGVSEYGSGEERFYQRGTLAHNTVCVDNQNSSQVWSGFRVARRAVPGNIKRIQTNNSVSISAEHDGYLYRKNAVIHQRKWECFANALIISDNLIGKFNCAQVFFHFHPDIELICLTNNQIKCVLPEGEVVLFSIVGNIHWRMENSYWCSEFGKKISNKKMILFIQDQVNSSIKITW